MKKYREIFYKKKYSFAKLPVVNSDLLVAYMMINHAYKIFIYICICSGIAYTVLNYIGIESFLEHILGKKIFCILYAFLMGIFRFLHTKISERCLDQGFTQMLSFKFSSYTYDDEESLKKTTNAIKDLVEYICPSKINVIMISMLPMLWFEVNAIRMCGYLTTKLLLTLIFGVMNIVLVLRRWDVRDLKHQILRGIETIIQDAKELGVDYDEKSK